MTTLQKKVYKQAMALPEKHRLSLAQDLWESVGKDYRGSGEEEDPEAEAAWKAEVDKRVAEIDSGKIKGMSHAELKRKLKAKHKWIR